MSNRPYQICIRCIMDTSDTEIKFDDQGICNHCKSYDLLQKSIIESEEKKTEKYKALIEEIKRESKDSEYHAVLGVSGGVDSCYLAYILKKEGLNVLIVHVDNGWNSELAVKNIENIVRKLNLDLYTYVINWEEFRDIQLSYLKASVLDLEAVSDHAIFAALYKVANLKNIKYIILGTNIATEGILPDSFRYAGKNYDATNLRAIHKKFGKVKIKTYPTMGLFGYFWEKYIKKVRIVSPLNYLDYQKDQAKKEIQEHLGWKDYGGKHYESIITRFYQGYILPEKFKIDKRRAHLSTLICSGQLTREDALKEIQNPPMDKETLAHDLEYVPKKLGLTPEEFQKILSLPPRKHSDYPNEKKYLEFYLKMKSKFFRK